MKFNDDQKSQLENFNILRSENQKFEFKFAAMEAELTSQHLINNNYNQIEDDVMNQTFQETQGNTKLEHSKKDSLNLRLKKFHA